MRLRSSSASPCRGMCRSRQPHAMRRSSRRLQAEDRRKVRRDAEWPFQYDVKGGTMRITRWIALGVAAVALAASSLAVAQDKVSLRLNWYLGGLHVPFYYGKDKGYYAAEGIDLTINEGRGSANTVQVVAAGSD